MTYALQNADVYIGGEFVKKNILISDGYIVKITDEAVSGEGGIVFDFQNHYIFPGFIDVHVHLREPGFSYKETIKNGSVAAAAGGYTSVCLMPNLSPVPDNLENLSKQLEIIKNDSSIEAIPFGAISVGEKGEVLSDMEDMAPYVAGFSDDGRGVQSEEMMKTAMERAKKLNKIISAHCEDNSLLSGGYIHDGEYAKKHSHRGICSKSEYAPIMRDIELVKQVGCKYHVCHISAKESVCAIREAKAAGANITCETAPHYLVLCDEDLKEEGRFKMNPPIRSASDRDELVSGLKDGTVDMIATDHAPHSEEEKSKGLKDSLMGVVGLESAFPVLYTKLVLNGVISLERLIELMHDNPKKRFEIGSEIKEGEKADICVFDLNRKYNINSENFVSAGKSTPFEGEAVFGKCVMTLKSGKIVWQEEK